MSFRMYLLLLGLVCRLGLVEAFLTAHGTSKFPSHRPLPALHPSPFSAKTSWQLHESSSSSSVSSTADVSYTTLQQDLLAQIAATPSNAPTSRAATQSILQTIRALEEQCPMENDIDDRQAFLTALAGNWELMWTTQDEQSDEWNLAGPLRRWIK